MFIIPFELAELDTKSPKALLKQDAGGVVWKPLHWAAAIIIAVGIGLRFVQTPRPLWLDETWTGAIAAQNSLQAVVHQIYNDVNAPLYYLLIHVWSIFFGISNEALRLPSALLSALAPLLAFLLDKKIDRSVALIGCALVALWIPGIVYSEEARCYGLLFALSMGGTIAYADLLLKPSLGRAALWIFLSTLMILTHYHAAFLVFCQGLGYLIVHRSKALRTWPALAVFLPALAWIGYYAPRIARFADLNVAGYPPLSFHELLAFSFVTVDTFTIALLLKWATRRSSKTEDENAAFPKVLWIVVTTSVVGACLSLLSACGGPASPFDIGCPSRRAFFSGRLSFLMSNAIVDRLNEMPEQSPINRADPSRRLVGTARDYGRILFATGIAWGSLGTMVVKSAALGVTKSILSGVREKRFSAGQRAALHKRRFHFCPALSSVLRTQRFGIELLSRRGAETINISSEKFAAGCSTETFATSPFGGRLDFLRRIEEELFAFPTLLPRSVFYRLLLIEQSEHRLGR